MAMRSAGLQGGYFIVAARALGLDCGPMSGFDRDGVDKEFFAGTAIKSYFLCDLGYGDPSGVRPARRAPGLRRSLQDSLVKILAVDTALGACSVALLDGDSVLAHHLRSHGARPCRSAGADGGRSDAQAGVDFAVAGPPGGHHGPGTFTGQRVGLAFMRGLRLALKKPLIGVTTLEAMAAAAMAETGLTKAAAIHDARRDEAYLLLRDGER